MLTLLSQLCPDDPDATAIPQHLFQRIQPTPSPTELSYSEDPSVLRRWRLAVAKKIEAVTGGAKCSNSRSTLKTESLWREEPIVWTAEEH